MASPAEDVYATVCKTRHLLIIVKSTDRIASFF